MKNNVDSRNKLSGILATLAIIIITSGAFYCSYYLDLAAPIKAIVWIVWLVLTLGLGLLTPKGKQIFKFAKESKIELQKVVWPSRQETVQTTSIVMVMVAITGFVLWGIDSAMMWIIGKITHLG